jgi:hypothetical protein
MTHPATQLATLLASKSSDEHSLVRKFDHRHLYFSKSEIRTVAADLKLDTTGTRSALCYRVARCLLA